MSEEKIKSINNSPSKDKEMRRAESKKFYKFKRDTSNSDYDDHSMRKSESKVSLKKKGSSVIEEEKIIKDKGKNKYDNDHQIEKQIEKQIESLEPNSKKKNNKLEVIMSNNSGEGNKDEKEAIKEKKGKKIIFNENKEL